MPPNRDDMAGEEPEDPLLLCPFFPPPDLLEQFPIVRTQLGNKKANWGQARGPPLGAHRRMDSRFGGQPEDRSTAFQKQRAERM